jgi:hypothetical protein
LPLSFAQAHFVLSMVAGIAPEKADTFQSRLKQWQKMGFPQGTRVGKGAKAEYGALQVFQLAILVKLLRVGLTPERAQKVITSAWPAFRGGIVEAILCMANGEDHLHYYLIQLDALSDLTTPGGADHLHTFVDVFTDREMLFAWDAPAEDWTSEERAQHEYSSFLVKNRMADAISVEIDSLIIWVWAALNAMGKGPDVFAADFAQWVHECRTENYRHQPSEHHFNADLHSQSVALRETGLNRVDQARAALSLVAENDLNPKA